MADHQTAHFQNDVGASEIHVGVKQFMCCGASAPYDHPHVFLDMGSEHEIVCPYCSTLFKHDKNLKSNETRPEGCVYEEKAA